MPEKPCQADVVKRKRTRTPLDARQMDQGPDPKERRLVSQLNDSTQLFQSATYDSRRVKRLRVLIKQAWFLQIPRISAVFVRALTFVRQTESPVSVNKQKFASHSHKYIVLLCHIASQCGSYFWIRCVPCVLQICSCYNLVCFCYTFVHLLEKHSDTDKANSH